VFGGIGPISAAPFASAEEKARIFRLAMIRASEKARSGGSGLRAGSLARASRSSAAEAAEAAAAAAAAAEERAGGAEGASQQQQQAAERHRADLLQLRFLLPAAAAAGLGLWMLG